MVPVQSVAAVEATSGEDNWFELGAPARGFLHRLRILQIGGVAAGYEFELYSKIAEGDEDQDLFSLTGPLTVDNNERLGIFPAPGTTIHSATPAVPYVNGHREVATPVRLLYLRVHPEGTGDKDFQAVLVTSNPAI